MTAPEVTARRRERAWSVAFWVTAFAGCLPFLFVRHPPLTDLPEHVAAMASMARLLPGGGGAPFEVNFATSQYLLYHGAGAVLTRVVGDALLANRLLLAAVAVLWPLSLRSALRAFGGDERLALFGSAVVYNRALGIGLLPFVASVPLALFTTAALVRQLDAPKRRNAVLLSALAIALFYTHVSAFVLFGAIAAPLVAMRVFRAPDARRVLAVTALPLLPAALLSLRWFRAGSLSTPGGELEQVSRTPFSVTLDALPIWSFDLWTTHLDEWTAALWWLFFAVVLVLRGESRGGGVRSAVPVAVAVAAFFVTPFGVGPAGYLNVRLAPMVTLFAVLVLRPRKGALGDVPLLGAALAGLLTAGNAAFEMRRLEREHLGDIDALLAKARPGTRLAMLNLQTRSPRVSGWPYPFAGSYHRAFGGAIASYSFSDLPHWPLHYTHDEAPPSRVPFWAYAPCSYRYREDGAYYDYVLVQGRTDPFAAPNPGPPFARIGATGSFTLYEKTGPAPSDGTPDRGPCPPKNAPP